MLKLTQEQYDWVLSVQQARLSLSLLETLDARWPDMMAKLGARKQAFVEAAMQQAELLGLTDPVLSARWLNLWCIWGPSFIDKPGFEWASEIARDFRIEPWMRIEQLVQATVDRVGANGRSTLSKDDVLASDEAITAAAGGPGVTPMVKPGQASRPRLRAVCDIQSFEVAISEQPWRAEYRMAWSGSEAIIRQAPVPVPVQLHRQDKPAPPGQVALPMQVAALATPPGKGHKAWLLVRTTMAHVCDHTVHPRIEIKSELGGQVTQGYAAGVVRFQLNSVDVGTLPPPFAAPAAAADAKRKPGDPVHVEFSKGLLCREVPPRHVQVVAASCGYRRYGAPLGEQRAMVAIHPADQWLLEVKTPPQPLWHWPSSQPQIQATPPVVRLERDGVPVTGSEWPRAWAQLNAALTLGLDGWHAALIKAGVLLDPRLEVEPGLMTGTMAWTWGMREVVQPEGSSACMRAQALIRLMACAMNLQLSADIRHLSAHARLHCRATGKAPLDVDFLHETPELPLAGKLATIKASWSFPFEVNVEALSSPQLGSMALKEGGKPFALTGELGLRPRPDGAGWAWYCTLKLEAATVPLLVMDPLLGHTLIQRDLWPETTLLNWSAG